MTKLRLLIASIFHYWRTNLAVMLGVIAGTAVIGGALIVGDSVRGSLRQMTYDRLGEIDHVLTGPRFFREQLADDLANDPRFQQRFESVAPALVLLGAMETGTPPAGADAAPSPSIRRVGQVNIYGIDERLWKLTDHGPVTHPENNEVILSRRVARQLDVAAGDAVSMWIELPAAIPRDSLLGKREETTIQIPLKVKTVLAADSRVGRLNLNPNQQLPFNAFVSLKTLQEELKLHRRVIRDRKRRRNIIKPARVNTLFVHAKSSDDAEQESARDAAMKLSDFLSGHVRLDDLFLRIEKHQRNDAAHEYLSLESEQQILGTEFGNVGQAAAKKLDLKSSPVLVYLGNEYSQAGVEAAGNYSRYSIVAGVDFATMQQPPFGPLEFIGPAPAFPLNERQILINEWLAEDLKIKQPGAKLEIRYHLVGAHIVGEDGRLPEETITFTVAGIVKLAGTVADDRGITPRVEGITDADSFDDWDKPFEMKEVTARDDEYWKRYGPTPKAFVSLKTAQDLWASRYGNLTSVRVAKLPSKSLAESEDAYTGEFLSTLTPAQSGLLFQPVKFQGLQAAGGTTDFSALFLAFSFFLILSATILIGLLFRLGIERRSTGIGLLNAVGFTPQQVRRQFLAEGMTVVTLGGLLGSAAAWAYAAVMVYGLKTWWVGAIGTRFLDVYVQPASLAIGFFSSVIVAGIAVWWAMRQTRKIATRDLLAGATEPPISSSGQRHRGKRAAQIAVASALAAAVLLAGALAGLIPAEEAFSGISWQVVAFFLVGILLLVAGLTALSWWLDSDKGVAVRGSGAAGIARLGVRNASRHRQRSVLTVALIASATFVIVAVAAGHRNPAVEAPVKSSGNGGFTLVAESSTPILHDMNTVAGRRKLNLDLEKDAKIADVRKRGDSATSLREQQKLLQQANVISFQVKPGEDASCLNIYQTRVPTILGVPPAMIERGGFKFVGAKVDNPWTLLDVEEPPEGDVPVYPVFGDLNTLQYSLHKSVGATVAVPNEENPQYKLKIVGMFDGSVFQGVLLLSQANFRKLYPDRAGYQYFLIETPEGETVEETKAIAARLSSLLESRLNDYGFDAEPVADRLADFLAVQNTYLSTFQTLGGLGLLLGTLGLATVMLRNVLERRSELALLRAVGFRNGSLSGMVMWENTVLLVWGLAAGTISALLAMTPHLASTGADVPWSAVGWILGGVFLIGTIAALLAVAEAVRTPIVATLRAE